DYVGIAGHTIGTEGASVKDEYQTETGSPPVVDWVTFASEVNPGDDAPLLFLNGPVFARNVRITITGDDGSPDGISPPQVAVIYIGKILAMQRMIYGGHSPIPLQRDTTLQHALIRGGRFLGQAFRRKGVVGGASFQNLTPSWLRENFDPFILSARRFPFFFAW